MPALNHLSQRRSMIAGLVVATSIATGITAHIRDSMLDGLMFVACPIVTAANVWMMYKIPLLRRSWIGLRFWAVIAVGVAGSVSYVANGLARTIAEKVATIAAAVILVTQLAARWIYKLDQEEETQSQSH
jgi:hypothetical protein